MRASATREKLNVFNMLNKEKIAPFCPIVDFVLRNLCYYYASFRPHRECFYYFVLYGHGKSDLEFVHGKAENCVGSNMICPKKVHISEAETAEENNRATSFGEKGFFICGHIS